MNKLFALLLLLLPVSSFGNNIVYKNSDDINVNAFLTVVFVFLFLLIIVFYFLKKQKKIAEIFNLKQPLKDIKVSSHYGGNGIRVHCLYYKNREYVFLEKSNNLLQVDIENGSAAPESVVESE